MRDLDMFSLRFLAHAGWLHPCGCRGYRGLGFRVCNPNPEP